MKRVTRRAALWVAGILVAAAVGSLTADDFSGIVARALAAAARRSRELGEPGK